MQMFVRASQDERRKPGKPTATSRHPALRKRFVPDLVTTLICPPLNSPYSASKLLARIRNSAIESRLGITDAPLFTSSSTSLPLTIKLLANSRCPLMDTVPGFRSPEGERTLAPTSCTVSEVIEVTGATPGCSASKSVKLRPFSGTAVILRSRDDLTILRVSRFYLKLVFGNDDGVRVLAEPKNDVNFQSAVGVKNDACLSIVSEGWARDLQ